MLYTYVHDVFVLTDIGAFKYCVCVCMCVCACVELGVCHWLYICIIHLFAGACNSLPVHNTWDLNPPTPAASRGSASEEALLATRGAVLHCHGVWGLRQGPWTRADGRKKQSLKLVSRQFRKQRQRRNDQQQGPTSHYKQQGQEARKQERRSKKQFPQARSVPQGPAVWLWRRRRFGSDSAGRQTGQRASFLVGSESNVRHWGPWPAGPVPPSGPCCFGVAKAPFVSIRGWKTDSSES